MALGATNFSNQPSAEVNRPLIRSGSGCVSTWLINLRALVLAMMTGSRSQMDDTVDIMGGTNGVLNTSSSLSLRIRSMGDENYLSSVADETSSGDSSPGIISKCLTTSTS